VVGELINQIVSDSVAFWLPMFYSEQLPDFSIRGITAQNAPSSLVTMQIAPHNLGLSMPEPKSLQVQFDSSKKNFSWQENNK